MTVMDTHTDAEARKNMDRITCAWFTRSETGAIEARFCTFPAAALEVAEKVPLFKEDPDEDPA